MVTCCICLEPTKECGELDCCDHRFCWPCITQWAERETRCPLCKQRFNVIKRKAIYLGDPHAEAPRKRRRLDTPAAPDAAGSDAAADGELGAAAAAVGDGPAAATGSPSDSSSCPESPKGRLEGVVLEVKHVQPRDQVYVYEGDADYANFLQTLHCMVCGGDENEEHLLICDGCDQGYHTYCVNRRTVPLGDWYCPTCRQQRRRQQQQHQQERQRQPRRQQGQTQQRSSGRSSSRRQQTSPAAANAAADVIDLANSDNSEAELQDSEAEAAARDFGAGIADSDEELWLDEAFSDEEAEDFVDLGSVLWSHDEHSGEEPSPPAAARAQRRGTRGRLRTTAAAAAAAAGLGLTSRRGRRAPRSNSSRSRTSAAAGGRLRSTAAAASGGRASGQGSWAATSADSVGNQQQQAHAAPLPAVRLRTWHELREEPGQPTRPAGVTQGTSSSRNTRAGAAAGRSSSGRSGTQRAAAAATLAGAAAEARLESSQEEAAWQVLDQLQQEQQQRQDATAAQASRSNRRAGGTTAAAANGRAGANGVGLPNRQPRRLHRLDTLSDGASNPSARVNSAYFGTGPAAAAGALGRGVGSSSQHAASDEQQAQLRAALMARLQRQRQQQQQGPEWSNSNPPDVREPGYTDSIRDDLAAARARGEELRRRRLLAGSGAQQAAVPHASVTGTGAAAAAAAAAQRRAAVGGVGAAEARVSSLGREAAAARRAEALQRERLRRRHQLQESWQRSSSNIMGRWLSSADTAAAASDTAAAGAGGGHAQQQGPDGPVVRNQALPRSARTVGAVRRGAAVAAVAAGAAGAVGAASAAGASGSFERQQGGAPAMQRGAGGRRLPLDMTASGAAAGGGQGVRVSSSYFQPASRPAAAGVARPRLDLVAAGQQPRGGQQLQVDPGQHSRQHFGHYTGRNLHLHTGGSTHTCAAGVEYQQQQQQQQQQQLGSQPDQLEARALSPADAPTTPSGVGQWQQAADPQHLMGRAAQPLHQQQQQEHQQQHHQQQQPPWPPLPHPLLQPQLLVGQQQQQQQQQQPLQHAQQHSEPAWIDAAMPLGSQPPSMFDPLTAGHISSAAQHQHHTPTCWQHQQGQQQQQQHQQAQQQQQKHHDQLPPPSGDRHSAGWLPPPASSQDALSYGAEQQQPQHTQGSPDRKQQQQQQQQQQQCEPQSKHEPGHVSIQVPSVGTILLSYDDLKEAKSSALALAKARLAGAYSSGQIDKETFAAAAKAATHGLYERVKLGEVLLPDLVAAAAAARGGGVGQAGVAVSEVVHLADVLLAEAGVVVD